MSGLFDMFPVFDVPSDEDKSTDQSIDHATEGHHEATGPTQEKISGQGGDNRRSRQITIVNLGEDTYLIKCTNCRRSVTSFKVLFFHECRP